MHAIATDGLCKRYGRKVALRDVALRVPAGSLFGFLGPNGAGKTTTIRILLGLLRATSGHARLLGGDAWRDGPKLRVRVGYLPGDVRFYDRLTGARTLAYFAAVRGGGCDAEIKRLRDVFNLDLNVRVRRYSRGMKQKLGLIQALMHKPELLILDEPSASLDPLVRIALNNELRAAAGEGRTVLFSSHTLSEVEELCDHVAIVRAGRLVEQERIEVLRRRALRHVEVRFAETPPARETYPEGLAELSRENNQLRATWSGAPDALLKWLAALHVADVSIGAPELEDLFLAHYNAAGTAEHDA